MGFINGTVRVCNRLDENERVFHNGHKCVNGIKFYESFMNHLGMFNFSILCNRPVCTYLHTRSFL